MKMMDYTYNDKIYDFTLTMASKAEIDDMQFKVFKDLKNPEVFTLISEQESNGAEIVRLEGLKEKAEKPEDLHKYETLLSEAKGKRDALMVKILPKMGDYIGLIKDQMDAIEVATILLMNNKKYKDTMTETLAHEILEDMEYSLGFIEFNEKMDELLDKVFTTITLVQDKRDTVMEKINKSKPKNNNQGLMN